MTKSICEGDQAALARKAVRARALIDPLGAKGFRRPSERIRQEANARRLAFFAALAAFAGTFGAIIATAPDTVPLSNSSSTIAANVVSEHLVPAVKPGDPPTLIRIVQPEPQAVRTPDVRTRSS